MVIRYVLFLIGLSMFVYQSEAHHHFVKNKEFSSKFKSTAAENMYECAEMCTNDRNCGAFALRMRQIRNRNMVECFIEDTSGNITLESNSDLFIMVKVSGHRCKEDSPKTVAPAPTLISLQNNETGFQDGCPGNFSTLNLTGGCYYPVLDKRLNWRAAEAACQKLDSRAHLISVDNPDVCLILITCFDFGF